MKNLKVLIPTTVEALYLPVLKATLQRRGFDFEVIGLGMTYIDWTWKQFQVLAWLNAYGSGYRHVMQLDAFDTLMLGDEREVMDVFSSYGAAILLSSDPGCWPHYNARDKFRPVPSCTPYVNSGVYLGETAAVQATLKHMLRDLSCIYNDDQCLWAQAHLETPSQIKIDYRSKLSLSMYNTPHKLTWDDINLRATLEDGTTKPCILHGNGGTNLRRYAQDIEPNIVVTIPLRFAPGPRPQPINREAGNKKALCPTSPDDNSCFARFPSSTQTPSQPGRKSRRRSANSGASASEALRVEKRARSRD